MLIRRDRQLNIDINRIREYGLRRSAFGARSPLQFANLTPLRSGRRITREHFTLRGRSSASQSDARTAAHETDRVALTTSPLREKELLSENTNLPHKESSRTNLSSRHVDATEAARLGVKSGW